MPVSPASPLCRNPLVGALITAMLIAPSAFAAGPGGTAPQSHDPDHEPVDLSAVKVRASVLPGTAEDLARPVEVLAGERLDTAKASSLGETVNKLPGVQSSYFGPGVGRPIVRGFDGARVQVLSDGLGSGDVSTVSADHAVSIEPFLANQIEVLKGPSTLLYGSGAIGGAVNVIDGRIPEAATDEPLQGRAELRAGTVNDEKTGMLRLDGTSASGKLVFHFDALHRETGNYAIPGFAESARQLAAEGETPDPATSGTLANSALRTDSGALGLSWVGERGFAGVGYSLFNTRYGVPGHSHDDGDGDGHGHDAGDGHDHGDDAHGDDTHGGDAVHILMDQRRTEVRAGLDELGVFETLRIKFADTRYTHTEFEGEAIGTVFDNSSKEARLELVHQPWAGWRGAFGVQWAHRKFDAVGAEAFVPGTEGNDTGLFWIGERRSGDFKFELGARHDRNTIDAVPQPLAPLRANSRKFEALSGSAAVQWELSDRFHASLGLDRSQRVPTAEELFSNGLHVATGTMEIGDETLGVETANRLELGLRWHGERIDLGAAVYGIRYADFIYQAIPTSLDDPGNPLLDGGVPVRLWSQADARFHGMEADATIALVDNDRGAWDLRVFGDIVRGKLASGGNERDVDVEVFHGGHAHRHAARISEQGNLPRLAPARLGSELSWSNGTWRASLGAVRYLKQDRVATNETTTPGYTLVDAHLAWHRDTPTGNAWEVFVDGSNLLDQEARPHTSFLKDLAPLPGRGIAFGVRAFF
ncbi:TonB-dependent receptor [Lysobacter sp. H23M47]|nr:TonB-dependent receptor [Lysobacter sp. H23M47]